MSSLPGFSRVSTVISQVEVDQTFEKSMQQLNKNQNYYVFPEDAKIINKKGQILEWKYSNDVYLFPIDATTFRDKDGIQYQLTNDSYLNSIITINKLQNVVDWDYTTTFIDISNGNTYPCSIDFIDISEAEGFIKLPPTVIASPGIEFMIQQLNCTLDISKTNISNAYLDTSVFTEKTTTGKIILNQNQYENMSSRIQEIENLEWLNGLIQVEVQP